MVSAVFYITWRVDYLGTLSGDKGIIKIKSMPKSKPLKSWKNLKRGIRLFKSGKNLGDIGEPEKETGKRNMKKYQIIYADPFDNSLWYDTIEVYGIIKRTTIGKSRRTLCLL